MTVRKRRRTSAATFPWRRGGPPGRVAAPPERLVLVAVCQHQPLYALNVCGVGSTVNTTWRPGEEESTAAMTAIGETDPLVNAVDALCRFDPDKVPEGTADKEVFRRVSDLLLTVAAIGELHGRDEEPTHAAVAAEVDAISRRDELAGVGFAVNRVDVREVAEGFSAHGDEVRAETVERAWKWMLLMVMIVQALS